jgi:putative flippase GtrA
VKVRFVLVGSWAVIFSYLVFVGLHTFFLYVYAPRYVAYMMAAILANIIAILNSFILHKYVTFKSKVKGKGILSEFIKFCTAYSVTFCLSLILFPIFVEVFHIPPKLFGALIIPVCAVINYLGNSRFAFKIKG